MVWMIIEQKWLPYLCGKTEEAHNMDEELAKSQCSLERLPLWLSKHLIKTLAGSQWLQCETNLTKLLKQDRKVITKILCFMTAWPEKFQFAAKSTGNEVLREFTLRTGVVGSRIQDLYIVDYVVDWLKCGCFRLHRNEA
eukprot:7320077-Lingulodinium_polyedra.AAC.1